MKKRAWRRSSRDASIEDVRSVLQIMANELRRDIIISLAEHPLETATLAARLGCSPSTARHHLKRLIDHNIVQVDRSSRRNLYMVTNAVTIGKRGSMLNIKITTPSGGAVGMQVKC